MMMNLDGDHLSDLPALCGSTTIGGIFSNPTVTAPALKRMKAQRGLSAGVQAAHDILDHFGGGRIGHWDHDLGGVSWKAFSNRYFWDFDDTNNLSLAVFVSWGSFTILFGGDMECAGWERLLKIRSFVDRLKDVRVYVASHHGRDSGRCDALFDHMRPEVVIFSDGPKVHATQDTTAWYGRRVTGIVDTSKPATVFGPVRRKVLTTRSDGSLRIDVQQSGAYTVWYERTEPTIEEIIAALLPKLPPLPATPFNGRVRW